MSYSYERATSRNIGWITPEEQLRLRRTRVAIAGLGGVGGSHLLTLTRLGIGCFSLCDFDTFEVENFNRQAGAMVSSLGQPKIDVLAKMAADINPALELRLLQDPLEAGNMDEFLAQVDLYVDGLDFFSFSARAAVFAACAERAIPAITVAPLGMGASLLIFLPGRMGFEEYFRWAGCSDDEKAIRFLVGLSPAMLQRGYLVDRSAVDFASHRGPSTAMACELCAGIAATEALKILLNRGNVVAAPRGVHFDAYRNRLATTWRPWGNGNLLQRLAIAIARRQLCRAVA